MGGSDLFTGTLDLLILGIIGMTQEFRHKTAVPTFPNATYHVSRAEYETAMNPNERTAASYFARNFQPLEAAGVLEWAEDGSEVAPGIRVFATPGHTLHHLAVSVDDGAGRRIVFLGDLVPTAHHLPNPWVMAYDLFPLTTLETKQRLLPELHDQECLCAFVHDAERPLAYLAATDRPGRFRADPERDPWLESKSAIHTNGEENHR